jgi:hypothetical protein
LGAALSWPDAGRSEVGSCLVSSWLFNEIKNWFKFQRPVRIPALDLSGCWLYTVSFFVVLGWSFRKLPHDKLRTKIMALATFSRVLRGAAARTSVTSLARSAAGPLQLRNRTYGGLRDEDRACHHPSTTHHQPLRHSSSLFSASLPDPFQGECCVGGCCETAMNDVHDAWEQNRNTLLLL